ncbi:hypothetical protein [Mycolicibacter kumamotonensis]|uniref:Uncharacterized protein n=1 Tax=Mycolicibacter kumamotonensis TaxID=354243 RepID=A0A1B8SKA7_9MYCO|nr:hypothetical protein [Mycolicibacter kumamotonensis]NDJ88325.1 hypothetical protein [Mycolicibacter kumamotonensis]OBY33172.1 hypothetical protein ACT18_02410 [Mycolicibacter kumamotonensis]
MPALRTLLTPFLLWWRYWPQLAACYLAGLVVRRAVIAAAAWTGHRNPLWAALIMPCAGLAQLGSYVAMFLVLRTGIPALAALPRRPLRSVDLFTNVIVPFFAIYLGWQMFKEDWLAYQRLALNYRVADALSGVNTEMLPVSRVTWVIVGAALAARFVLAHFSGRLPAVLTAARVYIDALWVFLVLTFSLAAGITFLIKPGEWLSQRRLVVWFNNLRGDAFSHFQALESAWQSLMWLVRTAFGGAAVPLMWLAAAGIVYGVSTQIDWPAMLRRPAPGEAAAGFAQRWRKAPEPLRSRASEYARSKTGRFGPIVDAARLILHGGPVALSGYVLAYLVLAWLDMRGSFYRTQLTEGYLFRGMAKILGPHGPEFWSAFGGTMGLISQLIVQPLRIALITAMFAYCVHRANAAAGEVRGSQHDSQDDGAVRIDQVHGGGHGIGGQQEAQLQRSGPAASVGGATDQWRGVADGSGLPAAPPIGDDGPAFPGRWRAGSLDGDDG